MEKENIRDLVVTFRAGKGDSEVREQLEQFSIRVLAEARELICDEIQRRLLLWEEKMNGSG